jgi:hypothetical protein
MAAIARPEEMFIILPQLTSRIKMLSYPYKGNHVLVVNFRPGGRRCVPPAALKIDAMVVDEDVSAAEVRNDSICERLCTLIGGQIRRNTDNCSLGLHAKLFSNRFGFLLFTAGNNNQSAFLRQVSQRWPFQYLLSCPSPTLVC